MPAFHPSRLVLTIERHSEGGLVMSSPHLPGWRVAARGPVGIASAIQEAWHEYDVRAYVNSRGGAYDATGREVDGEPVLVADGSWHDLGNGTWLSPGGSTYREDTAVVRKVRSKQLA
ncbi:MAG: hypothetical protein JWO15_3752 [Sphingomonadales bacterium]|nr:hypothetical protein [Sphingomonadales bacterium]